MKSITTKCRQWIWDINFVFEEFLGSPIPPPALRKTPDTRPFGRPPGPLGALSAGPPERRVHDKDKKWTCGKAKRSEKAHSQDVGHLGTRAALNLDHAWPPLRPRGCWISFPTAARDSWARSLPCHPGPPRPEPRRLPPARERDRNLPPKGHQPSAPSVPS